MKQYEKYVQSNWWWYDLVPSNWTSTRLKYSLKEIIGGGTPNTGNLEYWDDQKGMPWVSIADITSSEGYLETTNKRITEKAISENNLSIIPRNTLLISIFASLGKTTVLGIDAVVNQAILGLITNERILKRNFLEYYLVFSETFISYFSSANTQENLNLTKIKNLPIYLPTEKEQIAISNYLDRQTVDLDKLISQKKKLIEILKEERIAITNTAVTKGLNAKAKMKPSGVEWIGDIPEHWKVKRIKYVSTVQGRIGFKGYKSSDLVIEGEGALVLGATHITRDHKIDITEPVFLTWEKYYESPEIMVKKGDVVFTQRGVYLGKVALIDKDYGNLTINPSLILLKENLINSGYLTFFLTSHYIRKTIELISSNTAIPMISQENLSNFYCLVPPRNEQEQIFDFVTKSNSKIDLTISQIEKEIELVQEYRTALISEVVTGKIKVTA